MSEYLDIYQRVKPDLRAIDKMFGSSEPTEAEPYASDMAAAQDELKVLAGAVEAAEKASPSPIAPQGVEAIKQGRSIWAPIESKSQRELARAWLSWAMPDRCDTTARTLAAKSALLGQALKFNVPPPADIQTSAPEAPQVQPTTAAPPTTEPPATAPPPPAPTVQQTGSPVTQSADKDVTPPSPEARTAPTATVPPPSPAAEPYHLPDPNGPVPDAAPQGPVPQS